MDLMERAGELIMAGFHGAALSPETISQIQEDRLSSFLLFSRNMQDPDQIRRLTTQLQSLAPGDLPMLIATDQEGGVVSRLAGVAGTDLPGSMALGATNSELLTYRAALACGSELLALGINWNLAPVLDINGNPQRPVMHVRSYGETPELVTRLGTAAIRGYHDSTLLCCGKHFPGLGDSGVDSHFDLPMVNHGRERLQQVELIPFRAAIGLGISALMIGHVVMRAFDTDAPRPATLSRRILTDLLRREFGFEGLIVTDDLEMAAIAGRYGVDRAAVEAIKAGADLVIVAHTPALQRRCVSALQAAIGSRELPPAQVEASLARIQAVRGRAACRAQPSRAVLACDEHRQLAATIANAAVTIERDREGLLPLSSEDTGFVICNPEPAVSEPLLACLAREHVPGTELLIVDQAPTSAQLGAAEELAQRSRTVVVATHSAFLVPAQQSLVRAIFSHNRRVALLAQRAPYDLRCFPEIGTAVAVYEDRARMLAAGLHTLFR